MPYGQFLGYEKDENGLPRIVESEATTVRLIYRLFLEGKTFSGIARHLTENHIPTPAGKKKWRPSTVESIYNAILIGQAAIIYAVAALIGGLLYRRAGFRLPLLESIFGQTEEEVNFKTWFSWAAGTGLAIAIVIIVGDYIFYKLGSPLSLFETELPAWWTGVLAAFSAGIGEELLMRFLLMTLLTLLFLKLFRMARPTAVWSAIILVALVFGALHLPATAELVELSSLIIVRAMLLNGIGGIAFGLLYWKQGLESAIVAHILTDVIVHGLMPIML